MRQPPAWLCAALLLGCGEDPTPPTPAAAVTAGPRLLFDGCERIVQQRCERDGEAPLSIWLDGARQGGTLTVERGSTTVASTVSLHPDGVRMHLADAPHGDYTILDDETAIASFSVVPVSRRYRAVRRLTITLFVQKVAPADIRRSITAAGALLGPTGTQAALCFRSELAYETDDWAEMQNVADALTARQVDSDDTKCTAKALSQAALAATERQPDHARALGYIEQARAIAPSLRERARADHMRGVLAQYSGEFDDAIVWLLRALEVNERLGAAAAQNSNDYRGQLVWVLSQLGRYEEAQQHSEAMVEPRPAHRVNPLWLAIVQREEDPSLPSLRPDTKALIESLGEQPKSTAYHNMLVNQAMVEYQDGALPQATKTLAAIDPGKLTTEAFVLARLTEARIEAKNGRAEPARDRLDEALAHAADTADANVQLRARLIRAEVDETLGDFEAARAHYAEADALEEQLAVGITPQAGRSMFARTWRRSRARRIALLLSHGEEGEALCVVLGSRARYLRSLQADSGRRDETFMTKRAELLLQRSRVVRELETLTQEQWKLSKDERERADLDARAKRAQLGDLSAQMVALLEQAPQTEPWSCDRVRSADRDRVLVTMHPTEQPERWWLFVDHAERIRISQVDVPNDASPAERGAVVEAALRDIARTQTGLAATELVVVPLGGFAEAELRSEALAALGIERAVYSLGLGHASEAPADNGGAVVLRGHTQDLRAAGDEAEHVSERLTAQRWSVRDTWAPDEKGERPALLHYAGHASHAGVTGWSSTLNLGPLSVSVGDLIAQASPPPVVVLGACDAAAIDPHALDGGINVATAFLLAGAQTVVAPTVEVDDAVAFRFAQWLYATPPTPSKPDELAAALATTSFAADQHDPAFAAWRVLVR